MRYVALGIVCYATALTAMAADVSPYAGEEVRNIKALSEQQIEAYLSGQGMGYAKAAELNGYPGPLHVLELAEELGLSEAQLQQTQGIYDAMRASAVALGEQLVERERALDQHFAQETINAEFLDSLATEIALLEGQIRRTHLAAHLEQKKVLSQHQVQLYNKLRGYDSSQGRDAHHGH